MQEFLTTGKGGKAQRRTDFFIPDADFEIAFK